MVIDIAPFNFERENDNHRITAPSTSAVYTRPYFRKSFDSRVMCALTGDVFVTYLLDVFAPDSPDIKGQSRCCTRQMYGRSPNLVRAVTLRIIRAIDESITGVAKGFAYP